MNCDVLSLVLFDLHLTSIDFPQVTFAFLIIADSASGILRWDDSRFLCVFSVEPSADGE
jgi:hypothetical protein